MENCKTRIDHKEISRCFAVRFTISLVVASALASLVGCETVRPYSEADAKAASSVRSSFRDAGLDKPFTAERDLVADQNRRQLAAVQDFTLARRDEALVNVISRGKDWRATLTTSIDRRLDGLLKVDPSKTEWEKAWGVNPDDRNLPNFPDFTAALEPIAAQERLLEQKSRLYASVKQPSDPQPSCHRGRDAQAVTTTVTFSVNARLAGEAYQQQCTALLGKDAAFRRSLAKVDKNSELGATIVEAQELALERALAVQSVMVAKGHFDEAVKAYKAALAAKGPLDGIRAAAAKVQERLDALGKASQAVAKLLPNEAARGELAKLEEQLNAVDGLLDALRAKAEDPPASSTDKSASAAASDEEATLLKVAATIRELSRAIDEGHHPRTGSLLIEQEHLRFMLARARARVAFDDKRIALVDLRRDAMIEEVNWLLKARQRVSTIKTLAESAAGNSDGGSGTNCEAALQQRDLLSSIPAPLPCTSRVGVLIATALTDYSASWTIARLAQQKAAVQEVGLRHVAVVDASESAFAEWQALLDVPLSQLETYYAGGLRAEDLANLINALGLGAIAIRVK